MNQAAHNEHEQTLKAWLEAMEAYSYYELLGITQTANQKELKAAFHAFALNFHPDRYRDSSAQAMRLAHQVFQRGVEAYRTLSKPATRADYDLDLARGMLRLGVAREPATGSRPGVRSLSDLCRSPAARLAARRAEACIDSGDLARAREHVIDAISKDGGENADLESRLDDLEAALHAMGGE